MKQVLCYGDSNTWGLIPGTNQRYGWGKRWTSLLQEKLNNEDVRILEEGLVGRTTIFDDIYRENRNGLKTLPLVLESHAPIDYVVIMLGTNDCKSHYSPNVYKIGRGIEQCIDKILETVPADKVFVISPIHLGKEVWKQEYDPEFDRDSVEVSKGLSEEYKNIATKKGVNFIAASEYVSPSEVDQEHLSEESHKKLASVIYQEIKSVI